MKNKCYICGIKEGFDLNRFNFINLNKCFRCGKYFCDVHYQGNCCLKCIQYYIDNPSLKPEEAIIPTQLDQNLINHIILFK